MVLLMLAYWGIAPLLGVDDKLVVGILTLGVFAAAYIGEIFRAGIESVDRGQFEAARSLGLSRRQTLRARRPAAGVQAHDPAAHERAHRPHEGDLPPLGHRRRSS